MTTEERLNRLENVVTSLASSVVAHDNQIEALLKIAEKQQGNIAEIRTESLERERRLDERIDKLVSAIGEFIRRNNGNGKKE